MGADQIGIADFSGTIELEFHWLYSLAGEVRALLCGTPALRVTAIAAASFVPKISFRDKAVSGEFDLR